MNLIHACMGLVAATSITLAPAAAAQPMQQRPPSEQRAQSPEPVTGELHSLNVASKTLVVKTAADSAMTFTFSDDTVIVGADKGKEGLATMTGSIVTVTYDVHGTANVALKIEVKPKR